MYDLFILINLKKKLFNMIDTLSKWVVIIFILSDKSLFFNKPALKCLLIMRFIKIIINYRVFRKGII